MMSFQGYVECNVLGIWQKSEKNQQYLQEIMYTIVNIYIENLIYL